MLWGGSARVRSDERDWSNGYLSLGFGYARRNIPSSNIHSCFFHLSSDFQITLPPSWKWSGDYGEKPDDEVDGTRELFQDGYAQYRSLMGFLGW